MEEVGGKGREGMEGMKQEMEKKRISDRFVGTIKRAIRGLTNRQTNKQTEYFDY